MTQPKPIIFVPIGQDMGYKYDKVDIVAKGAELIRKRGYHNLGVNAILKECGIPKGSFYNFFESKEDFAEGILEYYGKMGLDGIQKVLRDENLSPLNRLKKFYGYIIDANEEDGLDAGCLVHNMSVELGGINDRLRQAADKSFRLWLDEISLCIEKGQEQGEIRKDFTPTQLAEYLHAGTYGCFSRMKATRSREFLDEWFKMTFAFIGACGVEG